MKKVQILTTLIVAILVLAGLTGCKKKEKAPAQEAVETKKEEAKPAEKSAEESAEKLAEKPATAKPKDHPAH